MKRAAAIILPLSTGIAIGFCLRETVSPAEKRLTSQIIVGQTSTEPRIVFPTANVGQAKVHETGNGFNYGDNSNSIGQIRRALEHLKDIVDVTERARLFKTLIQRWVELDGHGAFAYVLSLEESEMKIQAMPIMVEALIHPDPQFLANQTLTMPNDRSSRELIQDLARGWAETDAQDALAWAKQLPDSFGKNDALAIACAQLGKRDPNEVSEVIGQLPTGDLRNSLISNLAAAWGANNPGEALQWANTLPDSEKTLAMPNLISAWAQRDPVSAGTYAVEMPAGAMQNQAVMSAVFGYANQDPPDAATWILKFPDDILRNQAIHTLMGTWVGSDSSSALTWANGLSDDRVRNTALEDFVESTAYWSPDKAASAISLISDQEQQEQSMQTLMRLWIQTDPASARNWLDHLNISNDRKAMLQTFLPSTN